MSFKRKRETITTKPEDAPLFEKVFKLCLKPEEATEIEINSSVLESLTNEALRAVLECVSSKTSNGDAERKTIKITPFLFKPFEDIQQLIAKLEHAKNKIREVMMSNIREQYPMVGNKRGNINWHKMVFQIEQVLEEREQKSNMKD